MERCGQIKMFNFFLKKKTRKTFAKYIAEKKFICVIHKEFLPINL